MQQFGLLDAVEARNAIEALLRPAISPVARFGANLGGLGDYFLDPVEQFVQAPEQLVELCHQTSSFL